MSDNVSPLILLQLPPYTQLIDIFMERTDFTVDLKNIISLKKRFSTV